MTARKNPAATPAPPPEPEIPFQGLIRLSKPGWEGVPDSPNPFYFGAKDGLFLHRRSLLGRGIARVDNWPNAFHEFGNKISGFMFEAPPIPAKLMGQIVNFFERIYDRQHTEAAVMLVMHSETKKWRVFIPTQMLSHGGMNYVFDPTHIKPPWLLVGSIHSHCDFGASHSSTDINDADSFDGLHCTIGMIKRPIPQIVAMISMNKRLMHYKEDQFSFIFDFSEPKEHEAPAWWDRYCEDTVNKTRPEGFDLFAKFGKDTKVKSEKSATVITRVGDPPSQPNKPHTNWPPIVGKSQHGLRSIPGIGVAPTRRPLGADPNDWSDFYVLQGMEGPPEGYENFNPESLIKNGYSWDPDALTWKWTGQTDDLYVDHILKESAEFNTRRRLGLLEDDEIKTQEDVYWEDLLSKEAIDTIFDSELVNDEDLEYAIRNPEKAGHIDHWKGVMLKKAFNAVYALREFGMEISLDYPKHPPADMDIKLLSEHTSPADTNKGQSPKGMN